MAESNRKVSVVIACRNEAKYIEQCIESVLNNDYGKENIEVLVVDGMSDDGSRKAVEAKMSKCTNVKLVDNTQKLTPFAFNLGIKNATGGYIIIMGGHSTMSSNYISTCVDILNSNPEIACVGGKIENVFEDNTSKIIASAMTSSFGVGGGNFRVKNVDGFVDTVGTPVYRKSIFDEIGLFDERLVRNQDDDLNFRITQKGYKIYIATKAFMKYYVRASYKKLYRQYYQYGYWKVFVNKKHNTITTLRQLAPAAFVLFVFFGILLLPVNKYFMYGYIAIMLTYIFTALCISVIKSADKTSFFKMTFTFFILHFGYGLGYINGIISFLLLNRSPATKQAKLSR